MPSKGGICTEQGEAGVFLSGVCASSLIVTGEQTPLFFIEKEGTVL